METLTGTTVVGGIAIGRIRYFAPFAYEASDAPAADPEEEVLRFEKSRYAVQDGLHDLYEKALNEAGEEEAEIFQAHEMMLDDEDLIASCISCIKEDGHLAEYAVVQAFDEAAAMFAAMEDPYFAARSADVIDLKNRMLEHLSGREQEEWTEPAILAAEDLAPSETVRLDKSLLLGIVTKGGSSSSHTAILARSLGIPTIIQCKDLSSECDGKEAILDGDGGCLHLEPDAETAKKLRDKKEAADRDLARLQELKGLDNITTDGHTVRIYANIGSPEDLESVLANDAGGIGLFRSEFLYLNGSAEPSEEEQSAAYRKVLEAMAPKQVIIRTCDIGADKTVDYMDLTPEDNPAMGLRAIRLCLTRRDFFKRQLRALLRASAYGNLGIMFPMIISVREVRECRALLEECGQELKAEGIQTGTYETGIMIETPAAALLADELAETVDFFSIGTNDLTQYTCALDRQNAALAPFLDPHHPALLKLIDMTVQAAHRHGIWAGICGELAADLSLTETFLRMGVDELSVSPVRILPLRDKVRNLNLT
ncbi:MAG: phosphoenolpyruvate--protein phosphotransferase [Lachnospiraceae bacterium]|nr:phosphoenolpyruvate--protein phosphotransferase [Lachnospiraceae bacterium]